MRSADAPSGGVAGVILAAGASTRFGSPKQLARVGEHTLLGLVVRTACLAGLDPVVAVVPPGLDVPAGAVTVTNPEPELGLSHSLRLGVEAVPAGAAALVLLGDEPSLRVDTVRRVLAARDARHSVVAARSAGVLAPPVLIEPSALAAVAEAGGDVGLRDWLRAHPDRVTPVDVAAHPADVDTPADLERLGTPCPGCGAWLAPRTDAAAHPYLGASVACWAAFGELIAREFADPAFGWVHRHTVDAYAGQHPGVDGRRQRQSVAVHLIGLCHWLEHDLEASALTPITRRLTADGRQWPWLDPPVFYEMTVVDVATAADGAEHGRLVRRWAESVWDAWAAYHETVRAWAADALRGGRRDA